MGRHFTRLDARASAGLAAVFGKTERNVLYARAFARKVADGVGLLQVPFASEHLLLRAEVLSRGPALAPAVSEAVTKWTLELSGGQADDTSRRGLLIRADGLPLLGPVASRVVALVDCAAHSSDEAVVRSLAAQLWGNVPGFHLGLAPGTGAVSLDELADVWLSRPLQSASSLLYVSEGKLVALVHVAPSGARSALRSVLDRTPPSFGLVVVSADEGVTKALADFACVGLQDVIKMPALDSAAGGEAPSPSAAAAAAQNKWVVTTIYVPGEGDDAARALACDLSASVWFDNDRPRIRLNQAHCGINSSAAVLGVVTKPFGSNALVQLELKLALAQGKRVVLVRETDLLCTRQQTTA